MNWTRIAETELGIKAWEILDVSNCQYHNGWHVMKMYNYLVETNEPYDESLDWAVLFHDIVYDALPKKEERSAEKFVEMGKQYVGTDGKMLDFLTMTRTVAMIYSTENHLCSHPEYSAIIRADLHGLTNPVDVVYNYIDVMEESMWLYKIDEKTFAEKNSEFMYKLYDNIESNMELDPTHREFYKDVKRGVVSITRLSQIIKGDL